MTEHKGNRYRSADELGLVPQRRQATISRIEPQEIQAYTPPNNDVPYRVSKNEHKDKAIGFAIATGPLTGIAALAAIFTARVGAGVPIFSVAMLAVLFVVAAVTYTGSWIFNTLVSHYGVKLVQAGLQYRLLRYEQKERHKYYREVQE